MMKYKIIFILLLLFISINSVIAIIPDIIINSGNGTQSYGNLNINHTINFTITDDNLDACWYEYNFTDTWVNLSNLNIDDCFGTEVSSIIFNPDNNLTYIGRDTGLCVYNETAETISNLNNTINVSVLAYDNNNNILYVGSPNGILLSYNITSGGWFNLSTKDISDWVGTSDITSLTFDSNNQLLYTGHSSTKLGVYNITDDTWYDLGTIAIKSGIQENSVIKSLVYDNNNDLLYSCHTLSGNTIHPVAKYNISSGSWSSILSASWKSGVGAWAYGYDCYSLAYDHTNDLLYTGHFLGRLGVYNNTAFVWDDLTGTQTTSFVGNAVVKSLVYDSNNDYVYTGLGKWVGTLAKLGIYDRTLNEWKDVTIIKDENWLGNYSIMSMAYNSYNDNIYTGLSSRIISYSPSGTDNSFGYYNPAVYDPIILSCSSETPYILSFPLIKGIYNARIYANNTDGNNSMEIVSWNYPNPTLTINTPTNNSVYETPSIPLNITLDQDWIINEWTINYNGTNITYTTLPETLNTTNNSELYNLQVWAETDLGTMGYNNTNFILNNKQVTLNTPLNNSLNIDQISFSCTGNNYYTLTNAKFYLWNTTSIVHTENKSIIGNTNTTLFN